MVDVNGKIWRWVTILQTVLLLSDNTRYNVSQLLYWTPKYCHYFIFSFQVCRNFLSLSMTRLYDTLCKNKCLRTKLQSSVQKEQFFYVGLHNISWLNRSRPLEKNTDSLASPHGTHDRILLKGNRTEKTSIPFGQLIFESRKLGNHIPPRSEVSWLLKGVYVLLML